MLIHTKKRKVSKPEDVANILRAILSAEDEIDQEKEHFWVIGIYSNSIIKYVDLVTVGILDTSLVHPREVFRRAIILGVSAIFVGHNHPSGSVQPSDEDYRTTSNLRASGEILEIELIDHIIIGNGTKEYFSFKEEGLL